MARTKSCECGGVLFSINPKLKEVEFICKDCNKVKLVNIGKYTTYWCKCNECNESLFKIRAEDNGNQEVLNVKYIKYKQSTRKIY